VFVSSRAILHLVSSLGQRDLLERAGPEHADALDVIEA
jgi:hypothetical protein